MKKKRKPKLRTSLYTTDKRTGGPHRSRRHVLPRKAKHRKQEE